KRCTDSEKGRIIYRRPDEDYYERVRAYRGSFPYEKALRKRRVWVEPLFAEAKDWHGMRRFRLRRLEKVNIEALLIASGQNVKRLLAFGGRKPKKLVQAAALRPPIATGYEISRTREHRSSRSWPPTKVFFNKLVRFRHLSSNRGNRRIPGRAFVVLVLLDLFMHHYHVVGIGRRYWRPGLRAPFPPTRSGWVMQDAGYELRRTPLLLGTSVNKGQRKAGAPR
ncbi:MAG TPA: transposase, partial [Rubrobacteraceae bacterium]|nr:transposase [Rubrobacteraceae bacterium]